MHRHFSLLMIFMLLMPQSVFSGSVNARDMKAALLYHFAVFTTWPEAKNDAFGICVFSEDTENINQELLEKKRIDNKPVRFVVINSKAELDRCQMLYLEESHYLEDPKFMESLGGYSLLTVAEVSSRSSYPGIVNIQLEEKKYLFTINNEAAKNANLVLSSKLLRLASKVY